MEIQSQKFDINKTADGFIRWIGSFSSLIVHSILFLGCFVIGLIWDHWDTVLLALTTIVSLEAIYLAIFIQMSINKNTASLQAVEADIDEIQEDVEDIAEDVDEIAEDVEELNEEDAEEETQEDLDRRLLKEIQENMARIAVDLDQLKKIRG
ncbi:MAG: hypothetical protein WCT26_01450 [Candidatus Buchananbacteria bacterium]